LNSRRAKSSARRRWRAGIDRGSSSPATVCTGSRGRASARISRRRAGSSPRSPAPAAPGHGRAPRRPAARGVQRVEARAGARERRRQQLHLALDQRMARRQSASTAAKRSTRTLRRLTIGCRRRPSSRRAARRPTARRPGPRSSAPSPARGPARRRAVQLASQLS
jgi:hypothetical protein